MESELAYKVEQFKKTKAELVEDAADAYGAGFEDALAQVACVHPELDVSPFAMSKSVIDGHSRPGPLPPDLVITFSAPSVGACNNFIFL